MVFVCQTCNISFTRNQSLERHYRSTAHKKREDKTTVIFKCDCGRSFLYKQGLAKHRSRCTTNMVESLEKNMEEMQTKHETEKECMQKEIEDLKEVIKSQQAPTIQHTKNINNTQHNTQHIHINCYGKEDLSYITKEFLRQIIDKPFTGIQALTKHIYFNDEHPENQNVRVTNKKLPYASVHKDGRWQLTDREKVAEDIMQRNYNLMDHTYDEEMGAMPQRGRDRYENFQIRYDSIEHQKQIKRDVDLCLLGGIIDP